MLRVMVLLLSRMARVGVVFALFGLVAAVAILASNANTTLGEALQHPASWRGLLAAVLSTTFWGPTLTDKRVPLFVSPFLGCLAGITALFTYFLIWPPEWDISTWKYVGIILMTYWYILVPSAMAAGILASLWNHGLPIRRRRSPIPPEEALPERIQP